MAIDRKPESGCEIQNTASGQRRVIIGLKVVKGAMEEELALSAAQNEDEMLHRAKVCKYLVQPWAFSDRVVCGYSFFASVPTAKELKFIGLRFLGVVKTATRMYPMAKHSNVELHNRGDWKGLILKEENGVTVMMAFVSMDQERRYFIATCLSLKEGQPYVRRHWR